MLLLEFLVLNKSQTRQYITLKLSSKVKYFKLDQLLCWVAHLGTPNATNLSPVLVLLLVQPVS